MSLMYSLKQWILKRFYDIKAVATTFISLKSMSYNNKVWEKIKISVKNS